MRFSAKLSVLSLLLFFLQFLVSGLFLPQFPQEVLRLQEYLSTGVDIVYLGDSTLFYPLSQVTTGELLQEMLPEHKVGEISHAAYNLDLYLHYVRYILRSNSRPQTIIVPINMRSFSPEWDLRPGYQFTKLKKTLDLGLFFSSIFARPLEVFGFYEPSISQATFLGATVYFDDEPVGTVQDFEGVTAKSPDAELQGDAGFVYHDALPSEEEAEAFRQALIYRYMYSLEPGHRQVQAMLEIAELGHDNGIEIVFYITPINYQQGERFLDDAFWEILKENVALVKSLLEDREATLVDAVADLEAFAFVDMEHLREAGKEHVASRLAEAIRSKEGQAARTATPTLTPTWTPTWPPTWTATPTFTPWPPTATPTATSTPTWASPALDSGMSTRVRPTTFGLSATASPTPEEMPSGHLTEIEYLWRSTPEGNYPVDFYRVRYQTLDQEGKVVSIRADLFVPYVQEPTQFPILVHAAGTTGIGNKCAPMNEQSLDRNWGNYRGHSLAYAAQGYIVILPNGLGFDDPERIHAYFIAELEAHVQLDAARAAYEFAGHPLASDVLADPAQAVFFMGYSSGGHAAFAARDWADAYAPELPIKGIMGFGPTTHVETLMKEDAVFSPYTVYAYRDLYGEEIIGVEDVFLPRWVDGFESNVLNKCVDDIFVYYSRSARDMYTPEFREILFGDKLSQEHPLFAEALATNSTGLRGGSRIPVLILQGTGDTVVTPDSQRAFKEQLCVQGARVTYLEYPAVAHVNIRWNSYGDALAWMQRIGQGDVPETDCVALNEQPEPEAELLMQEQ